MTATTDLMFRPHAEAPASELPEVDGGRLLDEAGAFLRRFAVLPSDAAYDACVLWAAHTHVKDAFNASPRLAALSEHPASGKTRLIELVAQLSHDPSMEIDVTAPALTALLSQRKCTVFLDETDTVFGTSGNASHAALRSILNSGYRQGSSVTRRQSGGYVQVPIYGCIGFAGLGTLPRATLSRCIAIRMEQRRPEQQIEAYFPRLHAPVGMGIGRALGDWASSVALDLASSWPQMPAGVEDRMSELWEPLISVGEAAGGSWAARARAACTELALDVAAEPAQSPGQRLLRDLRAVWAGTGNMPTSVLVEKLYALPGSPWSRLWPPASAPREMAALLAAYDVQPVKIRVGPDKTAQGYKHLALQRAWATLGDDSTDTEFSTTLVMKEA